MHLTGYVTDFWAVWLEKKAGNLNAIFNSFLGSDYKTFHKQMNYNFYIGQNSNSRQISFCDRMYWLE